jgi:hypothetical protein
VIDTTPPALAEMGRKTLAERAERSDHGVMDDTPRQCPFCQLRFVYHEEVKDHIVRDHPEHAAELVGLEVHELPHG